MTLSAFNEMPADEAVEKLLLCCGSVDWAEKIEKQRPFNSIPILMDQAEKVWLQLSREEHEAAFAHHPRIGDVNKLREKFTGTDTAVEQSGVTGAAEVTLTGLFEGNKEYEKKFGFIFLVFATGKTADEMLTLLRERLKNNPEKEWQIALTEHNKITLHRLHKILEKV